MREIKYRVWDRELKKMIQVTNVDLEAGSDYFTSDRYVVMQYIGSKDKNGKEIYEGDIVTNEYNNNLEVKYDIDCACFEPFGNDRYSKVAKNVEVIGNIYENPNLINK